MPKPTLSKINRYTDMINQHSGICDIERSEGMYAHISGTFTPKQLRLIADAMDELKEAFETKDYQSDQEYVSGENNEPI